MKILITKCYHDITENSHDSGAINIFSTIFYQKVCLFLRIAMIFENPAFIISEASHIYENLKEVLTTYVINILYLEITRTIIVVLNSPFKPNLENSFINI